MGWNEMVVLARYVNQSGSVAIPSLVDPNRSHAVNKEELLRELSHGDEVARQSGLYLWLRDDRNSISRRVP